MARQRLGVVLLVPQPLAAEVDGLRRALGDGALPRIAPHLTLVPPVNVHERDLPDALRQVRAAVAEVPPLTLELGPVATFAPVNPVAYLSVGGDGDQLVALERLRAACLAGPLERTTSHEFVPHVTVAEELAEDRLAAAVSALHDFRATLHVDRVHVLAEQPGRVWRPIADAPLGQAAGAVGRGSLPLEVTTAGSPDVEAAALLAIESDPPGLPFAVAARREGTLIAAAWGWTSGERLEVADLVVAAAHRGQGVGRHLLAAVEGLAARRGCTALGLSAPSSGAAAALLSASGWQVVADPAAPAGEHRRWQRRLPAPEPAAT